MDRRQTTSRRPAAAGNAWRRRLGTCSRTRSVANRARQARGLRNMSARRITVGIDVGGTFTDFFVLDEETGAFSVGKVPSTRGAEAAGVLAGIAEGGHPVASIGAIVH